MTYFILRRVQYAAMRSGMPYGFEPVTSGVRVSVTYGLYSEELFKEQSTPAPEHHSTLLANLATYIKVSFKTMTTDRAANLPEHLELGRSQPYQFCDMFSHCIEYNKCTDYSICLCANIHYSYDDYDWHVSVHTVHSANLSNLFQVEDNWLQ